MNQGNFGTWRVARAATATFHDYKNPEEKKIRHINVIRDFK